MEMSVVLFVIGGLIAIIWVAMEVKRMRHKIFAMFLIAIIIFTCLSFTLVIKKHDVQFNSVSGIIEGGKLYFSWLFSIFGNFQSITTNAVKMDWSGGNGTG